MTRYAARVRRILPHDARHLFSELDSPEKIQDFLEALPTNFETDGESNHSPLQVLKMKKAHCFEGAVFAAAVLAYHGERPLLMDFETIPKDEDHTVALFKRKRHWGALSKTNHAVLRYRDPVYATPREIAMSYFHEYYLYDGTKSMIAYSSPFDLSRFAPEEWITTEKNLDWLMTKMSKSGYFSIVPPNTKLRKATRVELEALNLTMQPDPRKKRMG